MLRITQCLQIYLRCFKIALIAVMEESSQYHTTWPLLRPHADQAMQRIERIALIAVMEESSQYHTTWPLLRPHADQAMQRIAYPLPLRPFSPTHTTKYIFKHCLWNPLLQKLAGWVRGCEKLNKSAPPPRQRKE